MKTSLQQIIHPIFRNRYERANVNDEIEPYFYRLIGVKDVNNYDNVLSTLENKCRDNEDQCIIFDNTIPLSGELELINYIYNELNNMNIGNLSNEDICIFDNLDFNKLFLRGLDYAVQLAIGKENFFNDNVRNNFITKLIVWGYTWLEKIDINRDAVPKCIYYGKIDRHEIYFLILLSIMKFDVIYINPLKEEHWDEIDSENLSKCEKEMQILPIETFADRVARGTVIENEETITKQLERDIHEQIFSNTGMFAPWQYRKGYTKSILLDTIMEDIFIYWNEPAKLRAGFKVEGDTVKVPCFFKKIDGQHANISEYQRLVNYCIEAPNSLFFNSGNISNDLEVSDDMYQLMFCQLSDGTFDIEEIKKLPMYKFAKYSMEVQNLLLRKFNETILDKTLYTKQFDRESSLKLLVLVISLNESIVRLVDNFDFTSNVPKIVIYLNDEDYITDSMLMLLGYIHNIGIDIVIFNPSGLLNVTNILKEDRINITRLAEMNYTSKYKKTITTKASIFSRILNSKN